MFSYLILLEKRNRIERKVPLLLLIPSYFLQKYKELSKKAKFSPQKCYFMKKSITFALIKLLNYGQK